MWTTLMKLDLTSVCLALFLGLIFMVLFEILRINSNRDQIPPGPRPLPFIGILPHLAKKPMEFIRTVSQYGEISTLYIGRKPTIVLNTIQVTKEALVQEAFSGRPSMPLIEWITNGLGKPMNPQHAIQNAVSNIICSIVFGDRFDYDNKRFSYLLKILNENFMLVGSPVGQIFNLAPFIKHFPGPHQKVMRNATELLGFIQDEVKEHKETLDPDSPRDFIDAYLLEIEKQKSNKDSTFHEENMVMSTADLFLAGTDTTSTTIRWGLIFLIQNPDVQERCHEEIVRVLGYDRLPSMDDRDKLPYTYATVHEIQRCANIVPLGVIHETIRPTKLQGYDIPQGTMIMSNLDAILSNKKHWKHPKAFNPENFLDENGNFCKPESFIAFSLGPRVCLGETLARTELFLYITSLLQRIHFSWPPEPQSIDMDGIMGIVRYPQTYNVVCRSRDTKD
ncbi:cytochrome P450 2B4-like isoform X1 [Labeo rohita]|uniref:Cytochrome P450 2B4-like isoform X1 n=1 Tax=Labeo rohita TaxID=84645 RepID=A0A498LK92_LABRO|nr:cytochrome P450 2B4-like isoform X1 [Labeo rohita]RXN13906.1 cytochrome P450 2B4-like isoform X1 [Labeo rohita]